MLRIFLKNLENIRIKHSIQNFDNKNLLSKDGKYQLFCPEKGTL